MTDSIDLLDRQNERLQARDGADFFGELRRFHEFLTAGPADVVRAVAELRHEADGIEERFAEHNADLLPELVALKRELVERAPEVDDSDSLRQGARMPSLEWQFGFANFDQLAGDGPDPLVVRQDCDTSAAGMMLRILESKLRELQWRTRSQRGQVEVSETNLRPDLDDLSHRLRNLTDRHRHAAQDFSQAVDNHGGVQMMYLDMAVAQMNPEPHEVQTDDDEHAWIDETFKRVAGGWHYVEDAMAGRPLDDRGRQVLAIDTEKLKPAAEHVYEDVRMKLATVPVPIPAPPPAAPLAQPPEPKYASRLWAWVQSPSYSLLGGPCLSGVITGLVTKQHAGLGLFIALAIVVAFVPPFFGWLPTLGTSGAARAFAVLVSVVVVILLANVGVVVAVIAFVVLTLAFALGQLTTG